MFAKKSLGQNFLNSPRVVSAIVTAGELKEGDVVLEIGPGKGVLTKELLKTPAHIKTIEKDDRLIPMLSQTFEKEIHGGRLEIIHGDILEIDIDNLGLENQYKVIANIPYYITGILIRKLLSAKTKPKSCVLMVQKEVADRVIAHDNKESILSLSIKAYAKVSLVMKVSRGNFFPIPNVDSAVIKLSDIKNPFANTETEDKFFEIIKTGFAQKRKKLISNLEKIIPREKLKEIFEKLNLGENTRAEDVSLETWLKITQLR